MTELNRPRILIAENDVLVRNLVSTILSNEGYFVLAAANDAEALELSRTFTGEIGLLIAKKKDLADMFAGERPGIRVILLSLSTSSALKEIVRKVDPGAFLRKALLPEKLSNSIHRALATPAVGERIEVV